jgi:hypothetical protein
MNPTAAEARRLAAGGKKGLRHWAVVQARRALVRRMRGDYGDSADMS